MLNRSDDLAQAIGRNELVTFGQIERCAEYRIGVDSVVAIHVVGVPGWPNSVTPSAQPAEQGSYQPLHDNH